MMLAVGCVILVGCGVRLRAVGLQLLAFVCISHMDISSSVCLALLEFLEGEERRGVPVVWHIHMVHLWVSDAWVRRSFKCVTGGGFGGCLVRLGVVSWL